MKSLESRLIAVEKAMGKHSPSAADIAQVRELVRKANERPMSVLSVEEAEQILNNIILQVRKGA